MIPTSLAILALLAALAPILHRLSHRFAGIALAAVTAGVGVMFAAALPSIAGGQVRAESWQWVGDLDVTLSFRLDGLALTFALLICFIGALVLLYSSSYLSGHARLGRFYATLIGFMTSMLGLVLADNLILVFIFWELTSITSFLLIGFNHDRGSARRAAVQALLITGLGGLVLLAGLSYGILPGLAIVVLQWPRPRGTPVGSVQAPARVHTRPEPRSWRAPEVTLEALNGIGPKSEPHRLDGLSASDADSVGACRYPVQRIETTADAPRVSINGSPRDIEERSADGIRKHRRDMGGDGQLRRRSI